MSRSTARDYQPGEMIPGTVYQVVRTLGAGGMGTVYDVEDTTIGKRYVLKTLHPDLGDRADLARRMQAEARTLARLNHANIVEVVTAGVTGDELRLPYYVMERLNGQSLRMVLQKKGQLELLHAYHIGIDLLDALDHAHDKAVVHRDVKPDNIFLHKTSSGITVTKLLDFGIMTLLDGGRGETGGRFVGTLRYTAPEQLQGAKPTPKMDLYAAGLVLFEMIAGRGPFDDEGDPQRIAQARLRKAPPRIGQFASVPDELEALVRSALSIDPAARPRDAFSFAAQLRNLKRRSHGPLSLSTENRSTVANVLSGAVEPSRPPIVRVHSQPPTVPAAQNAPAPFSVSVPPSTPPAGAKTTIRGMPPPTLPGSTLDSARAAHASTAPAIDREAPTGTMLPDTPRAPQNGTDPMIASVPLPKSGVAPTLPMTPAPASAPPAATMRSPSEPPSFRWPPEHPYPDRSESAQVHSMNAGARPKSGGATKMIVLGALGFVVIAGMVAVVAFVLLRGAIAARLAGPPPAESATASAAPPPAPIESAAPPPSAASAAASTAASAPSSVPAATTAAPRQSPPPPAPSRPREALPGSGL